MYNNSINLQLQGNYDAIELAETDQTTMLSSVSVEGADLASGQLKQLASVGDTYMINLKTFDQYFAPIEVYIEDLGIQISQSSVNKVATTTGTALFTQGISFDCYLTETGTPCSDKFNGKKASAFSLVFTPQEAGTAWIHSSFLPSSNFHVIVTEGVSTDAQTSNLISTKYSNASLDPSPKSSITVGSEVKLKIVPISYAKTQISASSLLSQCSIDQSYFTITVQGQVYKNSFQETDVENLILSARVTRAGTFTAHPRIMCNGYEYPIECNENQPLCQRTVITGNAASLSIVVPRDSESKAEIESQALSLGIETDVSKFFQQGENLVFDLIMTDSNGDHVSDYDFSRISVTCTFDYATNKISLGKTLTTGRYIFYADDSGNTLFKSLPPRENFYKVACSLGSITQTVAIDILNLKDPDYPKNIRVSGETVSFNDKVVQIEI